MDLSKAQEILDDLEKGSRKVALLTELVESVEVLADRGRELLEILETSNATLISANEEGKASNLELRRFLTDVETLHVDSQERLNSSVNSLEERQNSRLAEQNEKLDSGLVSITDQFENVRREITAQMNRDTGATQQKLNDIGNLSLGISEGNKKLDAKAEMFSQSLAVQNKFNKVLLGLLIANLGVLGFVLYTLLTASI